MRVVGISPASTLNVLVHKIAPFFLIIVVKSVKSRRIELMQMQHFCSFLDNLHVRCDSSKQLRGFSSLLCDSNEGLRGFSSSSVRSQ
jgi:hypothetical protein